MQHPLLQPIDKADTDTRTLTTATARIARVDQHDDKFTGRAALMYNFDSGFAPYLSYSTSFQPAAGTDRQGNPFEPTTGRQIEAGLKYQPAGSKAMVTAAVYELTQRNVLTPDPLSRSFSEQTGWKYMVIIEVQNGEIVSATWNGANRDGGTDKVTRSRSGEYGMAENGGAMAPWYEQAAAAD